MSPRDSQRQKLYDAEDEARRDERVKLVMRTFRSVDEMQAYCDKLTRSAWYKRTFPKGYMALEVRPGKGHRRATAHWNILQMPIWSRNEIVLLHEIAHTVTPGRCASHGWEFAANMLTLVRHQMGKEVHDILRGYFKQHRVRYTAPRAKRPLSEEAKAVLRERLAVARAAKAAGREG